MNVTLYGKGPLQKVKAPDTAFHDKVLEMGRSSWITWVGPKCTHKSPMRGKFDYGWKRRLCDRSREKLSQRERELCSWLWKTRSQGQGCTWSLEAGKGRERCSREPPGGVWSLHTSAWRTPFWTSVLQNCYDELVLF